MDYSNNAPVHVARDSREQSASSEMVRNEAPTVKAKRSGGIDRVRRALENVVGEEWVSDNPLDLAAYAFGGGSTHGHDEKGTPPDYVAIPGSTEDVHNVVRVANEYGVPVTPIGSGFSSNVQPFGGILLDFNPRMNRLLEINEDEGWALIEPGLNFGRFCRELVKHNMHFPIGSFPGTAAVLPHLLRNPGNWTLFSQNGGRDIISLEAVLGRGDIVRTGMAMLPEPDWAHTSCHVMMPELTGLFLKSVGTLGIVTRGSVRIYDRNELRQSPMGAFDCLEDAYKWVNKLTRSFLIEHGSIHHYNNVRFLSVFFNTRSPEDEVRELEKLHDSQTVPSYEKLQDIPYNIVPVMMSGLEGEFKERVKFVKEYAGRFNGYIMDETESRGIMGNMYDDWDQIFNRHIPGDEMLRMKYSGQEGMVGSVIYTGPTSRMIPMERDWLKKNYENGFPFCVYYTNPEDQGRSCYMRGGGVSRPNSPEDSKRLADVKVKIHNEMVKKHRVHPTPGAWRKNYQQKVSPDTYNLYRAIKQYCDPNNLMNPGFDPFATPHKGMMW